MLGQVLVTTESPSALRPLLRTAIQNEAKSLTHGIRRKAPTADCLRKAVRGI